MAMEIQGKLIKILAQVTGEGRNGAWTKQEFILETSEQYPKKVCISVWSEKINQLLRFQLGDEIRVSVNPESREYNERWFTELRAWRIDAAGQTGQASQGANPGTYQAPVAGSAPAPSAGAGQFQVASAGDDSFLSGDQEDLPF